MYELIRKPLGLRMSQDIFQRKIDQNHQNCMGTVGIVDGVQVFGNDSTHDLHLHEAMVRTRNMGIKLNFDICIIKSKSFSFFGNVYSTESTNPDPKKIQTIKQCRHHQPNRTSFPGIVNYLSHVHTCIVWFNIQSQETPEKGCSSSIDR